MPEIEKIEIIGLNHKCNVEFDLQKDCTILIGENGVGKTSAIKILQFLLSGMMSSVAEYVFESINIIDSETTYEFKKSDFLVPIDVIKEKFASQCLLDFEKKESILLQKSFDEMILEINKKELLGRFLDEIYYFDSFSTVLNNIIEKYFDSRILFKMDLEIAFECPCYESSPIYKSKFYRNLKYQQYWVSDVVFGDMVEKIRFPFNENSFIHFRFTQENEEVKKLESVCEEELKGILSHSRDYNIGMFFSELNTNLGTRVEFNYYLDREELKKILFPALYRKNNVDKVFDIHSAIRAQYFDYHIIARINDILIRGVKLYWEYCDNVRELDIEEVKELIDSVDKKVLYTHEHFICPIMAEELPYRINLARLVRRIKWEVENRTNEINSFFSDICLLRSFMDVFDDLSDAVLGIENATNPIRAFQDLISQYIDDKNVCVTPKGLSVYLKEDDTTKSDCDVFWSAEEDDWAYVAAELPINSLSSGECKIIMLAFYTTFADRAILIMDEPELSISIIWQQKLICDLLDYGQFHSIVVATHSPYIARDNALAEYIEYLP